MDQTSDRPVPDSVSVEKSSYLQYLPAIYHEHEFWGRFLLIFEDILAPIEEKIDQIDYYLDVRYTPREFVTWLASWIGIDFPSDGRFSPITRHRIPELVELYCRRGTRRGLREHIKTIFDADARISETRRGMMLGPSTRLGEDTVLSRSAGRNHFIVTVMVEKPETVDKGLVQRIVDVHCPAHATYSIVIQSL